MTVTARWRADAGTTEAELAEDGARWRADLDTASGGQGDAPTPHALLDGALAACTVLTLQLYAQRKNYPLTAAHAEVTHDEDREHYRMLRRVTLEGPLDETQRQDLLRVANACPIHKALHKQFAIDTELQP